LKDKIKFINCANTFANILEYLTEEQRSWIFEKTQDKIISFITDFYDLNTVYKYLSVEQRLFVFERIKGKIANMFTDLAISGSKANLKSWKSFFQLLSPEQYQECIEICKNELSKIYLSRGSSKFDFRNCNRMLSFLFLNLDSSQQNMLLDCVMRSSLK